MKTFLITLLVALALAPALHAAENEKKSRSRQAGKTERRIRNSIKLTDFETKGNWTEKEGGVLHLKPREGETGWKRYDAYLWFPEQYRDFVCQFEFKLGKGGNSGFYFRIADKVGRDQARIRDPAEG